MSDGGGYKKPPIHSRFRPGQSGNPKGRPKGAKGFAAELERELASKIPITEYGRRRRVSKRDAMVKMLVAKATKGDLRAVATVLAHTPVLSAPGIADADLQSDIDRLIVSDFARRGGRTDGAP